MTPFDNERYQSLQSICYHVSELNDAKIIRQFIKSFLRGKIIINNLEESKEQRLSLRQTIRVREENHIEEFKTFEDYLLWNPQAIGEALTSSTIRKQYNNERFEFYGDTVLNYLVVLEFFLCADQNWTEKDLDYWRIKIVENKNLAQINFRQQLYQYLIMDKNKIFNDVVPADFEHIDYHQNLKQKYLNEFQTKITQIRRQRFIINNATESEIEINELNIEYVELLKSILTKQNAFQLIKSKQAQLIVTEEKQKLFKNRAVTQEAGIEQAHEFIKNKLNILGFSLSEYAENRNKLMSEFGKIPIDANEIAQIFKLEKILNYEFSCKQIAIVALTHNSITESKNQKESQSNNPENDQLIQSKKLQNYERLEYLGDEILGLLVTQYIVGVTKDQKQNQNPEKMHKLRAQIINNTMLSLITIETNIYEFIRFDEQQETYRQQIDNFVQQVKENLKRQGSSKQNAIKFIGLNAYNCRKTYETALTLNYLKDDDTDLKKEFIQNIEKNDHEITLEQTYDLLLKHDVFPIDIEQLQESNIKIFGDVFESLITAVFLDSGSLDITQRVLFKILEPYLIIYANIDRQKDNKRAQLQDLWNKTKYFKELKFEMTQENTKDYIIYSGWIMTTEVMKLKFDAIVKSKVRKFYSKFYQFVQESIEQFEKIAEDLTYFNYLIFVKKFRVQWAQNQTSDS
ncbi:ribonuclease iii [Stylonychia lemnae]|uniref:Ribonuclease iii n=1 Tax=Stylonychia lemnae TaxID=5949 RepID=A0A078AF94_STYLE|nr:ribonuclease iii [Stylonychia lemnae]|eukprot:CDW79588.1 ribonuclease iii [Stylonychia lemnae]